MIRSLFLLSFISCLAFEVLAGGNSKTTNLRGTVTDKHGEALVGAKVDVVGTDKVIYTDFEGTFSLKEVPVSNREIKISHISYEERTVAVDLRNQSELQLQLSSK